MNTTDKIFLIFRALYDEDLGFQRLFQTGPLTRASGRTLISSFRASEMVRDHAAKHANIEVADMKLAEIERGLRVVLRRLELAFAKDAE